MRIYVRNTQGPVLKRWKDLNRKAEGFAVKTREDVQDEEGLVIRISYSNHYANYSSEIFLIIKLDLPSCSKDQLKEQGC